MKNLRIGYIRVVLCVAIMLFSCICCGTTSHAAKKNGWSKGYYYVDGNKQKSKWVTDKSGTYYLASSGKKVTGWKKIKGKYYYFNEAKGGILRNGARKTGVRLSKQSNDVLTIGIDMSQWQGNVNWKKIKKAGVDFVMLRLGYGKGRFGNTTCAMDPKFH